MRNSTKTQLSQELIRLNEENAELNIQLNGRTKELSCLYKLTQVLIHPYESVEMLLQQVIQIIPPALKFPENASCRIIYNQKEYSLPNFKKTPWSLIIPIEVFKHSYGSLEVCYLTEQSNDNPSIFSDNEKELLNTITRRISKMIELMNIQKELNNNYKFLESLINTIPNPIFYKDIDGRYLGCNNSFARDILNLPKEKIIGKTIFNLSKRIPPDLAVLYHEKDLAVYQGDNPQIYEANVLCRDNTQHTFVFYKSLFHNIEGKTAGLVGIMLDITAQKSQENDLNRQNIINIALAELYKPLIAKSSTILDFGNIVLKIAKSLTGSEHGYVSYIDPETQANVSHTLTEMLKGACQINEQEKRKVIFPIGNDGKYPSLWGYTLNTKQPFYTNDPANHPASNGIPAGHVPLNRFLSVPVMLEDELVGQIALSNSDHDYTDADLATIGKVAELYALALRRKRQDEALMQSEKKYRDLINTLQEGIWVIDQQGNTTFVNPRMAEILGYTYNEMIGKHLFEFMDDKGKKLTTEKIKQRHEGLKEEHDFEFIKKNGERIITSLVTAPIMDDEGNYQGAIAGVADITEKRAIEKKLQQYTAYLENNINMAQEYQHRLIAFDPPRIHNIKIYSEYLPSEKVGGDIFNIMKIGHFMIFYIADIAGHGVPSAILSTYIKAYLDNWIANYHILSLSELINLLKKNLIGQKIFEDNFLTLLLGKINLNNYQFTYLSAGHYLPLISRSAVENKKNKKIYKNNKIIDLTGNGVVISNMIRTKKKYQEKTIKLNLNDKVLLFSDGLIEWSNQNDEIIGLKGLKDYFYTNGLNRMNLQNFIQTIRKNKEQKDDITYLLIELNDVYQRDCRSDPATAASIIEEIEEEMSIRYNNRLMYKALQCFIELFHNAIEYGNQNNHLKLIHITLRFLKNKIHIWIEDQGKGFDWKKKMAEKPFSGENLRGRGIFLVKRFSKRIKYNTSGNRVFCEVTGNAD